MTDNRREQEGRDVMKEILYKRAVGYEAEETEVVMSKDGRPTQIKKIKKHIPGDVRAMKEYRRLYGMSGEEREDGDEKQLESVRDLADEMCKVVDKKSKLTNQEKLFCLFYCKSFNAAMAARKAGYVPNSPGISAQAGYNLLQRGEIRTTVQELKRLRFGQAMITEADVIEQLAKIAFADITDYVSYDGGTLTVKDSALVDGTVIDEVIEGSRGVKVRLADRQKALRLLMEYMSERRRAERDIDDEAL